MKITAKFLCRAVVGEARDGEYEIPDGSDVAGFMAAAAKENGTFSDNYMDFAIYLVNGGPASAKTPLKDGDSVLALMRLYGG